MPAPAELLKWIDASSDAFIARLAEAVAIPSISGDPAFRPHVLRMSDWVNARLQAVGVTTKQVDLGTHVMDGQTLPLPKAVLGRIGNDPAKKTVLIYGHFDVQPAAKSDGWETEPFVLTEEKDGRLVGRGSSDDKGPVLGWIGVLQWHHETQTPLPVNLVFCFEGMEENGSEGLDELVEREKDGWFKGVDCMCIVSRAFVFSFCGETYLGAERQLLAQHPHPCAHLRPPRPRLLQDQRLRPRARPPLRCVLSFIH